MTTSQYQHTNVTHRERETQDSAVHLLHRVLRYRYLGNLQVADHSAQFTALLDRHLPDWRSRKQDLDNFITLPIT